MNATDRYAIQASRTEPNSFNVIDQHERNEWGERAVEHAHLTLEEARRIAARLNAGQEAY